MVHSHEACFHFYRSMKEIKRLRSVEDESCREKIDHKASSSLPDFFAFVRAETNKDIIAWA